MTRRALIGHTGFVGSNLSSTGEYTDFYNSSNFESMAGEAFDEIVCSGISATKWLANKEPERDWSSIQSLLDVLRQTRARRFILISTIDVYPDPSQRLDEDATIENHPNHAYGRHRLAIETWVKERFADHMIVRLPALFGLGLKKNALYDLLNDNGVEKINPAGIFQWYPVGRLSSDIDRALAANLKLVNLFTEPFTMREIVEELFPDAPVGPVVQPAPTYDLRTKYAELFGGRNGFIMNSKEVMAALKSYVTAVRDRHTT
ncbi:NAD(P)-dependent oxidoreductase [Microvirga aerilata]|uniref:NAD(P)-dependent oxidoreductase n=1 Tax=Microvirga aerilata TaxID=670292 RepID=A0A936ZIB2_9HYPH|nr:NAD(P)-dependent oxidoreductase [Microvirga aerilata]MBL0405068.1 NAD(P)-dependent oxidoreductase [Microvirga aerilata]